MGKNYCNVSKKWCTSCKHGCCTFNGNELLLSKVHNCPKRELRRTVTLGELIRRYNVTDVLECLYEIWPKQIKNDEGYRIAYERLKELKPVDDEFVINVKDVYFNIEGKWSYDVTGFYNGTYYAMEYTDWHRWIGMQIDKETLEKHSNETIIAACLYEMTWCGYTPERIKERKEEFENSFYDD